MQVVLDTNILCKASEGSWTHISVMSLMREFKHCLTLDYDGIMLGEYQDEVGRNPIYQKWYKEMCERSQIYYCNGHISERIAKSLQSKNMHEPEDWVIVALAVNSAKYIVTEDSDFGKGDPTRAADHQEALSYLTDDLLLIVHDSVEACERLKTITRA